MVGIFVPEIEKFREGNMQEFLRERGRLFFRYMKIFPEIENRDVLRL